MTEKGQLHMILLSTIGIICQAWSKTDAQF